MSDKWNVPPRESHELGKPMTAERDAAVKDAERYRWLRNSASPSHNLPFVTSGADHGWGPEILADVALDAAIDAAMEKP